MQPTKTGNGQCYRSHCVAQNKILVSIVLCRCARVAQDGPCQSVLMTNESINCPQDDDDDVVEITYTVRREKDTHAI